MRRSQRRGVTTERAALVREVAAMVTAADVADTDSGRRVPSSSTA